MIKKNIENRRSRRCLVLNKVIKTKKQLAALKRMSRKNKSTLVPLNGKQLGLIIRSRTPKLQNLREFLKNSPYKPTPIKRSPTKKTYSDMKNAIETINEVSRRQ